MSGIPVIASRLAPISADLEELGAGISCDPGDEKGLADHILTLMGDDDLIAEMSRNGFAKSSSLAPTPDEWADDLLSVYGRMLDRAAVVPR